jgi:hypothetical protein
MTTKAMQGDHERRRAGGIDRKSELIIVSRYARHGKMHVLDIRERYHDEADNNAAVALHTS